MGLYKYNSVLKLSNLTRNLSLTNVENILILSENTLFNPKKPAAAYLISKDEIIMFALK